MNTPTQRDRLEARARELMSIVPRGIGARAPEWIVAELKDIATQLPLLDDGRHWTQAQGDTLAKIVSKDISLSRKVQS